MIIRAAFCIAIVLICVPHHPDLRLSPVVDASAIAGYAITDFSNDEKGSAILNRLIDLRNEIGNAQKSDDISAGYVVNRTVRVGRGRPVRRLAGKLFSK